MEQQQKCRIHDRNAVDQCKSKLHGHQHYYQKLLRLRHSLPIVVYGTFHGLLEDSETIYAYTRTLDDQTLTIACNFTDTEQPCDLFENGFSEELISNYKEHKAGLLQPYEARVVLN